MDRTNSSIIIYKLIQKIYLCKKIKETGLSIKKLNRLCHQHYKMS